MRIEIDQTARNDLLDDFLDSRIRDGSEKTIRHPIRGVGLNGSVDPRFGTFNHRVAQGPEDIAPGDHFADLDLRSADLIRTDGLGRLDDQTAQKIQFNGESGTSVQGKARDESGSWKEGIGFLEIAIDKQILPRN